MGKGATLFPFFVSLPQMTNRKTILYIHGMGGGGDSRIPCILRTYFEGYVVPSVSSSVSVLCRTYDFDPEIACSQIQGWVESLKPDLVIGESLGALHAMRISGIPHLLVSPAMNAPIYFEILSWLSLLPGVTRLFDRIYRPKDGDRQTLHFSRSILKKYLPHRSAALVRLAGQGDSESFHAFFGTDDHYRRSGIVSLRTWKRYFGNTYTIFEGTHFMEEDRIRDTLIPAALKMLNNI